MRKNHKQKGTHASEVLPFSLPSHTFSFFFSHLLQADISCIEGLGLQADAGPKPGRDFGIGWEHYSLPFTAEAGPISEVKIRRPGLGFGLRWLKRIKH